MSVPRLTATRPIHAPRPAPAMYERHATELRWTQEVRSKVARQMRILQEKWQDTGIADRDWDKVEVIVDRDTARVHFKGNCNDRAPLLRANLVNQGLPPDCMSLATCVRAGEPHMVLIIHTDIGDMVCDFPHGCWPCDDPKWRLHVWGEMELPGRPWGDLRVAKAGSLAGLLG